MLDTRQGPIGLRTRVAELASHPTSKVIVVGVAAVAVTPIVLPLLKPVLKATFKTGVMLFEKSKIAIAETGEYLADVAAEARAEVQAESQQPILSQAAASEASAVE